MGNSLNERPNIYDFWGNKTAYGCSLCHSKNGCTCNEKPIPTSCGCKLELSVECIRWTNEPTNLYKKGENLQNILKNIENILGSSTGEIILQNLGNGQGVYKGYVGGVYQFKTLVATDGVNITSQSETLTFSVDSNYNKIQIGDKFYFYDTNPSETIIVAYNVWLTDEELHDKVQYNGTGAMTNPLNWTSVGSSINFS